MSNVANIGGIWRSAVRHLISVHYVPDLIGGQTPQCMQMLHVIFRQRQQHRKCNIKCTIQLHFYM